MLPGTVCVWAEECNRFAVQVATNPVPYQHPHGLERTAALLSKMPDQADTILVGDSLVEFWPQGMASKQFKSAHLWNIGVGGAQSQHILWQLAKFDVPVLKPNRVFVLIGTNNLTSAAMPACAVAAGVKAVVAAAHRKWPGAKLDVMGIPPRGSDFHFRDGDRLAVNAEIKAWSQPFSYLHYFEVDASEMTCGQYDAPLKVADASGKPGTGSRCANYADDFGHFKRDGYDVIFSTMMRQ